MITIITNMDYFDVTFRFNNDEKTLDRYNGMSIDVLADFLNSLYSVTKGISDNGLVLSEIKGNCYAIVCSTPNITTSEYIQTLHSHIAKGEYKSLKYTEKEYSNKLMGILSNNLTLNVYNNDKSYYKTIRKTIQPKLFPYFYETDSITGILTRIGARNINTKNTIMVSSYPGEIEINTSQDNMLKDFYKTHILEFYITKRINKNTQKVDKTTLDDFTQINRDKLSFGQSILDIRSKHGKYFAETNIEDE